MQDILERIAQERIELGYSPTEEALWAIDYDRKPVSVREFIESEDYIGRYTANLHPVWKQELDVVFAPNSTINTWILTGAIGTGKTTVAKIASAYKLYCLSCLKDPAQFYGLLPGSSIVFGCFNITLKRTETGYETLKSWIDSSPYFQKHCPRIKRPDDPITFRGKRVVYDVGSLETHAIGENMFAFELDEANFHKKVAGQEETTRAHKLFENARTRLLSRYMQSGGIVPGIILLISSRVQHTSFIEEQIRLYESDPAYRKTTHVTDLPLWATKEKNRYCGKTFSIAIGDEIKESVILEEDELAPGQEIVSVPVEYKQRFEEDMVGSLMNIAGRSVVGSHSYISSRQSIRQCIDTSRDNPFDSYTFQDVGINIVRVERSSGKTIQDHLDLRKICEVKQSHWQPRVHPNAVRFAHNDLALTKDGLGICVGHVAYDTKHTSFFVYIDLIIHLQANRGEEMDLAKIVLFYKFLRKHGFKFGYITFDSFESRTSIQALAAAKFKPRLQSITLQHYQLLRNMLFEGRVSYYEHPVLLKELREIRNPQVPGKRPEHPLGGHDDLADGLCGCVALCSGFHKYDGKKPEKVGPKGHLAGTPLLSTVPR